MNDDRTIAIGDIHGCSTALATLIDTIQPGPLDTVVFLGACMDSRGVIELMIRLAEQCQARPDRDRWRVHRLVPACRPVQERRLARMASCEGAIEATIERLTAA
jgi:hypothetical protein